MEINQKGLQKYQNGLSHKNQLARLIWTLTWNVLARPFPRSAGSSWKRFLLRIFGAKIHKTAIVYSSVRIYMPWHLEMHEHSCLAPEVDCYNVAKIIIGPYATVSQKSYLCSASHDIMDRSHQLITAPISIKEKAWVGTSCFIGMGVTIHEGAVVGATASVFKDVEAWTVVGGNPAKFIKKRILKDD
ncbi:putative colanic acid biosynthesis acetyltransferase WcaF [Maribacter orientalis]|uniref:Putative colanic acid biosynthesis acetyltransferase WcaF n=1 Tax=Maribacter orientalis TaxID=228957 RepID=A0A1H7NAK0_9FLAO|nr:putative colanic acid biosynthesis acetyltransferase [Maribacter orientalis]SEL19947.1 putative colanic acid biosynthesis acetyltransferase WcaF [Maribacter orientalis]